MQIFEEEAKKRIVNMKENLNWELHT